MVNKKTNSKEKKNYSDFSIIIVFIGAMPLTWFSLLGLIYASGLVLLSSASAPNNVFTSSFLVRFQRSVENELAQKIASKYGFDNLGPVS